MSEKETGGPAFPALARWGSNGLPAPALQENGMTLRDYFAAKAMQGLIVDPERVDQSREECARLSYAMADALLKARNA